MAICTAPSINWTPVGAAMVPVPYQTVQDLSNSIGTARTVRFNGAPAYLLDQTTQPKGTGDERGTGKGVRSGTVGGEVKPVSGCKTVRIEGKFVVREGDKCIMNGGNNPGVFVTATPTFPALPLDSPRNNVPCNFFEQTKKDAMNLATDEMRQNSLYQAIGKTFPKTVVPQHFFAPIRSDAPDSQHLRSANNIVMALLGPFAAPAVLARVNGADEEAVSAANSVGAGLLSALGAGILGGRSPRTKQDVPLRVPTSLNTKLTIISHSGLRVAAPGKELQYKPTSGVRLIADPERTTTVLGSYAKDMKHIVQETGNIKSTDLGARKGDFNILNVPDELYITPKQFWNEYNKPWLDNSITRNDKILMATKPRFDYETAPDGRRYSVLTTKDADTGKTKLSGFGREYLRKH